MKKGDLLKMRTLLINYDKEIEMMREECTAAKAQADSTCRAAILKEMGMDERLAQKESASNANIQLLRDQWSNYIDSVHNSFERSINDHKKQSANKISSYYKAQLSVTNQSTLTINGKVSYQQDSPFAYAMKHPFASNSKSLLIFRSIVVILAILWALFAIFMAISDANYGYSISYFFSSPIIYVGLYASIVYIAIEFVWSFLVNKKLIDDKNAQHKANAEFENAKMLTNMAQAKANLRKFEDTYGKYFKTDKGTWDFSAEKTPVDRKIAESLLQDAKSAHVCPKLPVGMTEYKFEINYQSL